MWEELEKILREMRINYQRKEESFICLFQREKSKIWVVLKILELGKEAYLLQAKVPQLCKIGESDRQKTTEKINEINQRLQYGVIILDPEDGEAYYGWTIPIEKELRGQEVSLFLSLVINLVESLSSEISALPGTNHPNFETNPDPVQDSNERLLAAEKELDELTNEGDEETENRRIELCHYLLKWFSKDTDSIIWAYLNMTLGDLLRARYNRENSVFDFQNGVTAYLETLKVYDRDKFSHDYAHTNYCLGDLYSTRYKNEIWLDDFHKAEQAYLKALQVYTPEQFPFECPNTNSSLGDLYSTRYTNEECADDFHKAEAAYLTALDVYSKNLSPLYASTIRNLGKLYHKRFTKDKNNSDLEAADQAYLAALQVFTKEQYLDEYTEIQKDRDSLHQLRQQQ